MRINASGIELKGWHLLLIAIVLGMVIAATTVTQMQKNKLDFERDKIIAEEQSERGHWLWGHWDDVAEDVEVTNDTRP